MKKAERIDFVHNDYFTRNGIVQPLSHDRYFGIGQEEPTREELVEALFKLTHNRYWVKFIKVSLSLAVALIAYVLLWITQIPPQ